MDALGLKEGDVIEIIGKRSTAARALRPYGADEAIEIIRSMGFSAPTPASDRRFRRNSQVRSKPATRVVFAPAQDNIRLQGSTEALKRSFAGLPLTDNASSQPPGISASMPIGRECPQMLKHRRSRSRKSGWSQ